MLGCASVLAVSASGVAKSPIDTLILEGCAALAELPETAGAKLGGVSLLSLEGCTALVKIPEWVVAMEKNGYAVIRPEHLR